MENIEPLPFEVEVIEFIDPLTTFADGVKLRLQTKDKIVFTCNYNYSPFYYKTNWWNRKKLNAEYNKKYREIFFKGKNLIVEATLDETSSDHCVIETAPTSKNLVKEYAELDWEVIGEVKSRGIPIILISHNMPHVFEVADRVHIHRLGKRLCVVNPKDYSMSDAVALMTGAKEAPTN
mgnify:CR=1 FL=1